MTEALSDLPNAEARRLAALCQKTQRARLHGRADDAPWSEIDAETLAQVAKRTTRFGARK